MAIPGTRLIQQAYHAIKARTNQRVVALMIPTWEGGIRPEYWDRTFENYVREGYKKNEIVYACINVTAKTAASVALKVRDKATKQEIVNHPCQQLLNRPNPMMTEYDFWTATISSMMLSGVSYWQKIRKGSGDVLQLWPMRPDEVHPISTDDQGLVRYDIVKRGVTVLSLDTNDMLVFKLYDPLDVFSKVSPLEVISRVVDTDNALTDFIKTFMQKGAMPPAILTSKLKLVDDAVSDIQRRWAERYGGHDNWLKPVVLDSDATYQRIGVTLDELRFGELGSRTASRICMVYSIPPIMVGTEVGLERGTYSNYDQSRRQWWEDSLGAQYKQMGNGVQTQLVDVDYDSDVVVEWDFSKVAALQEERTGRWTRATGACTAGIITVNMALKEMGLPTVGKEGDVFLRNASIVAIPNNPSDDAPNTDDVSTDEPIEDDTVQDEGKAAEFKDFTNDAQRRWFFANNPSFAMDNRMPHLQEGADREIHRQQLENFAENRKNRVANHLWDSGMIKYNDQAQVVVDHDKTKGNAADLMKDVRDATLSRDYLVSSFAQSEGHIGTQQQLESKLNAVYADKASATLLATHVGGIKLTDAQHRRLQSMSQGNYLNDKYSQYASGNNGTLIGVQHERLRGMSADAQHQREDNRRDFRTNVRKSANQDGKALTTNSVPPPTDTMKVVGRKIPTPEALRVVPFTDDEKTKIFEHYHDVKVKVGK